MIENLDPRSAGSVLAPVNGGHVQAALVGADPDSAFMAMREVLGCGVGEGQRAHAASLSSLVGRQRLMRHWGQNHRAAPAVA